METKQTRHEKSIQQNRDVIELNRDVIERYDTLEGVIQKIRHSGPG